MLPTFRTPRLAPALVLAVSLLSACQDGPMDPVAPQGTPEVPADARSGNVVANPFAGASFYVDPASNARKQADAWRSSRPADAAQMDKIATRSSARWFGEWSGDIRAAADAAATAITSAGALPVFVAYNIPQRDCGGLSGGGGATPTAYKAWISDMAAGIGRRKAVVILEPDALAGMDCLSETDRQTRVDLLSYAIRTLKAQKQISVYLDAGHARWHSPTEIASRLRRAGVDQANGFSLNVSNFHATGLNVTYGADVSAQVGGKHFVVDTSRNGLGATADSEWCNPDGRALGTPATAETGHALVDALLWIKAPGESDGACNGAPTAGTWWAEYALGLAQRAAF